MSSQGSPRQAGGNLILQQKDGCGKVPFAAHRSSSAGRVAPWAAALFRFATISASLTIMATAFFLKPAAVNALSLCSRPPGVLLQTILDYFIAIGAELLAYALIITPSPLSSFVLVSHDLLAFFCKRGSYFCSVPHLSPQTWSQIQGTTYRR